MASRYILGNQGYVDLARIKPGQQAVVVLNPAEKNARFEASKNLKAAFYKAGKHCELATQLILLETEPGVWREGHVLTITALV